MLCKVQHTKSQFKWCQFAKLQDVIQCLYSIDCSAQSAHEVEEEWLAKSRLDHAYQHRCCNQETVDGLVDSKSLKRHPDVLIPKWSQMWCMHGVHSTQVYDACSIYFNGFNTDLQMFCPILFLSTTLCCVSDIYQASRLIRLFRHPSDTAMQAWALGVPIGHSLPSPLPSIWYSKLTLTDTPPLATLCKMNTPVKQLRWSNKIFSCLSCCLHILIANYNYARLSMATASSMSVWALWFCFTNFWRSMCVQ